MRYLIFGLLFLALIISGCAPALIGGGAAGTYKAGTDERTVGTIIDDSAISTNVKMNLIGNSEVKARRIDVDVIDGVVTLTGVVESVNEIKKAEEITLSIEGVKSVTNLLTVGKKSFSQIMDDKFIVGKINKDLIAEPNMKSWSIDVDSNNGVVTLTGIVENTDVKNRALDIASRTEGVVKVIDNLKVTNP
jgi:hyperosmotically inducible protein